MFVQSIITKIITITFVVGVNSFGKYILERKDYCLEMRMTLFEQRPNIYLKSPRGTF